jgi:hypothetical protein
MAAAEASINSRAPLSSSGTYSSGYNTMEKGGSSRNSLVGDGDEDDYDQLTVSTPRTGLNLIKAFLGTGLLAVPFAVSCAGIWLGVIFVGFLTLLSNHTLKMLVTMARFVQENAQNNVMMLAT